MNMHQSRENGASFAIIGTGALGGYYGARLHHAGYDVHFLLHSDYDHVREHGLKVESIHGDFSIPNPHAYHDAAAMPACDFAIVGLKTTQNHLLPHLLATVVKPGGAAVMMQNGLGVEEQAAAVVGADRVMCGLAFLCTNKVGPGHIKHMDYGQIRLAEYAADGRAVGVTPRMKRLEVCLTKAGLPIVLEEDLVLARWKKLVWNVPYNGLTVVLDTTTDQLMKLPATRQLCEDLMREVAAGAAAFGRTIDDRFIDQMLEHTDKMVPYRPSMKLDYDCGRPMEVEAIYGNPIRAAAQRGVNLPRIGALYQQLSFIDQRLRGA